MPTMGPRGPPRRASANGTRASAETPLKTAPHRPHRAAARQGAHQVQSGAGVGTARRTFATSRTDAPLRFASSAPAHRFRSGLRPDGTAQVLGGINGQSIARRLTAAASAAGIEGRITGHSGRVGLAVELTRRGAPEQATAKAGGWKSSRMVAHYAAAVAAEQGAVATYL